MNAPSPLQSLYEGLRKHLANRQAARRAQPAQPATGARRTLPRGEA